MAEAPMVAKRVAAPDSALWPAIRARIEERCDEVGECLRYRSRQAAPVVGWQGGRRTMTLGRLYWLVTGRKVAADLCVSSSCGDPFCVAHLLVRTKVQVSRAAARRGAFDANPLKVAKVALRLRARSRFSDAVIEAVRGSDEPSAVLAERFGMTRAYVNMLKAGRFRLPLANTNPWAGLMGVS